MTANFNDIRSTLWEPIELVLQSFSPDPSWSRDRRESTVLVGVVGLVISIAGRIFGIIPATFPFYFEASCVSLIYSGMSARRFFFYVPLFAIYACAGTALVQRLYKVFK